MNRHQGGGSRRWIEVDYDYDYEHEHDMDPGRIRQRTYEDMYLGVLPKIHGRDDGGIVQYANVCYDRR